MGCKTKLSARVGSNKSGHLLRLRWLAGQAPLASHVRRDRVIAYGDVEIHATNMCLGT